MTEVVITNLKQTDCNNLLLQCLSTDDFATLALSMERITGQQRDCLSEVGVAGEFVYFPETAVASVTSQCDPMRLEIGFVGREGFVGIPAVLSDGRWPATTFVQIPGTLLRMPAAAFRAAVMASPTLLDLTLRYVQAYLVQVAQTAVANGSFNVEERLSRWLLMALDRVGHVEIALTHDFLAIMLGVRRPGVTVAMHILEGLHAIKATRGRILVTSRGKLEEVAGASYGTAEREYVRLIGASLPQVRGVRDRSSLTELQPDGRSNLAGQNVLVVEDDYVLASETDRAIRLLGGHVLGPVGRERDALALIAKGVPRCALVDLNLGDGVRFAVASALQDRGIPFVFVTGYDDDLIPSRFDDVARLRKPVDMRDVVRATTRLCSAA